MRFRIVHILPKGRRRASILVLTLWIVVILGILSASMLEEVFLEMRIAKYQRDSFKASMLARAGLARGITDLRNDLILDKADGRQQPFDALSDIWAQWQEGKDKVKIKMGDGTYSVWVDDEMAKINLNVAPIELIRAALLELKYDEKKSAEIASAIIDYRDADSIVQPPGAVTEDRYYSSKVAKSRDTAWNEEDAPIFRCKNDLFTSVDELLSVPGVTPQMFYGFDPEKEGAPNPIDELKQRGKEARKAGRKQVHRGMREVFTVMPLMAGAAANINTVDPLALRAVLRVVLNDPSAAQTITDQIINLRKAKPGGARGANVFRTLPDLTFRANVSQQIVNKMNQLMNPMNTTSKHFRIWALGEVNGTQSLICALVVRDYEILPPDQVEQLFEQGAVNKRLMDSFRRRHGTGRGNQPIEQATVRVMQWYEL